MLRDSDEAHFIEFIRGSFDTGSWNFVQTGEYSHLALFREATTICELNGIFVGFVDLDDVNAVAFEHKGSECIGITRGIVKSLHYVFALVASCVKEPFFDLAEPWDEEKRLDATRFRKGRRDRLHLSPGQRLLGWLLTDIALAFVLLHEFGHHESGHIHWLRHRLGKENSALFEQPLKNASPAQLLGIASEPVTALEADADIDGVTALLNFIEECVAESEGDFTGPFLLLKDLTARYVAIDIAMGVFFVVFSHQSPSIGNYKDLHPHPVIRRTYCHRGMLVYFEQSGRDADLDAYRSWVQSPKFPYFYWEIEYVLNGPQHLEDYFANHSFLSGQIDGAIRELWESSRSTWNTVSECALERRARRDFAAEG